MTNEFIEKPEVFKAPHVAMMKVRSPQCFDHGFYRDANWDFQGWTDEQLWHNFIHSGQFEARPHRLILPLPPSLDCNSKGAGCHGHGVLWHCLQPKEALSP